KALGRARRVRPSGSMTMDPRSARLNTAIALGMRSPALAAQVVQPFEDVAASSSYRVEAPADGRLRWVGQAPGAPTVEGTEPDAGAGLQLMLMLLSPFAPDELL